VLTGEIDPLAALSPYENFAIEELGIGWIGVSQPVPAFPQSIDVRVMQIEDRVASDRGEFGHVAPESEMREEVRVLIEPGIEPKAPLRRVDVELLVQRIETDPVSVEVIDPFAALTQNQRVPLYSGVPGRRNAAGRMKSSDFRSPGSSTEA
jgi:hypothetical protein